MFHGRKDGKILYYYVQHDSHPFCPTADCSFEGVRGRAAVLLSALVMGSVLILSVPQDAFSRTLAREQVEIIMIGDRLVDVAYSLGVVPAAMSVRCSMWPMCDSLKATVQVLGCPDCLFKKKAAPLVAFAGQHGIKRVLIEKSAPFCEYVPDLKLENIAFLLEDKGFEIEIVDFTKGLHGAVRQTAKLLNCAGKADQILQQYNTAMGKTHHKIEGKQFAQKAVLLRGTYQAGTGKAFLRIEAPGGYADRFLLKPLGIENVGGSMVSSGQKPVKGHIIIRKLDGLAVVAPDVIVMTGDSLAVQKALAEALKKNPALAEVPAIRDHAIFTLPGYIDAGVMEYPHILQRWVEVLSL
jgi:hypothetical protein